MEKAITDQAATLVALDWITRRRNEFLKATQDSRIPLREMTQIVGIFETIRSVLQTAVAQPTAAEEVCAEAYQLVGQLTDLIPDAQKWLDNLSHARLVHTDLLPVVVDGIDWRGNLESFVLAVHARDPAIVASIRAECFDDSDWATAIDAAVGAF